MLTAVVLPGPLHLQSADRAENDAPTTVSPTTKKYFAITFLVVLIVAPAVYLSRIMKSPGMLLPSIATTAAFVGFFVVFPYMIVVRFRRMKGNVAQSDYTTPEGLTSEERRRSIARQNAQTLITCGLLLALLLVVAWRELYSRH